MERVHKEFKYVYKNLLDCHIANLYSFYFKLFKYERYVKNTMNRDITDTVNDTIDVVNSAIQTGEEVYHLVGDLPELSVGFLTNRATLDHGIHMVSEEPVIDLLKDDYSSIDKTLSLTIHCTKSMALEEECIHLADSQKEIFEAFNKLQVLLQ